MNKLIIFEMQGNTLVFKTQKNKGLLSAMQGIIKQKEMVKSLRRLFDSNYSKIIF